MRRMFDELDRNHDQRISKQEFKVYKNALINGQEHFHRATFDDQMRSTFALFDHNRDNYISSQEIRETMKNSGEHIDDRLIEEMMRTADIDHDGRISRDEFEQLFIELNRK
jgi:Ca2+-binding EF-hand superfamily protein